MKSVRISFSDISHINGEIQYLHNGKLVESGAFELKENAELKILLPRKAGAVGVFVRLYDANLVALGEYNCKLSGNDLKYDFFGYKLKNLNVGLYFFSLRIITAAGEVFGMRYGTRSLYLSEKEEGNHFQFSIADFKYLYPEKYLGGIIYHVFVDRFAKGGKVPLRDDAVMIDDWDNGIPEYPEYPGAHLENNTFFGGTLYGIIEKLDYIKSLGTTLIYLSPIFESYSNHKYDTGDYMKVDSMFGGDEALKLLISEAKSRGIEIILDGVFNHTGADSIYFNKKGRYKTVGAYQSKSSPYYGWYDFQSYPNKYTAWWGIEILPRINPDIPQCGEFIAGDNGVIDKYSKLGIAGFRLDVADELSDNFIARIKSKLSENVAQNLLYGEVWEDASNKIAYDKRKRYYLGDELDGVMNYPVRTGIISFLAKKDKSALEYALGEVMFNTPMRIRNLQMNLLGTHDTERIITILAGESADGKTNAEIAFMHLDAPSLCKGIKLLKMAYAILATIPGLPTVFYGDEVGLEGYKDPFNRRPYPWNSANEEIRDFYKRVGQIRRSADVYKDGDFRIIHFDNESLVFMRSSGSEAYITAVNNSMDDLKLVFSKDAEAMLDSASSNVVGKNISIRSMDIQIIKTKANSNIEIVKS